MNGQQWSMSGLSFAYEPAVVLSSVSPARGAAEGGVVVTVFGGGFSAAAESSGALVCRWDGSIVEAVYISGTAVACSTATATAAGYVTVRVSTNGRDFTSDGLRYEQLAVGLTAARPWSGPELGGTVVTIGGRGLAHRVEEHEGQRGDGV